MRPKCKFIKPAKKTAYEKIGFTIIELLTVLSVIMILIGMLVPSLNAIRKYSRDVTQRNQFYDIGKCLEMFSIDFDGYPDSSRTDPDGQNYCGAMKLCEALVGQDGLGFHPDSVFDDLGLAAGVSLYFWHGIAPPGPAPTPAEELNLRARKKCIEKTQTAPIQPLTAGGSAGIFDPCCTVLCDVYQRHDLRNGNEKLGMPVLYYKADQSKLTHDANEGVINNTNIYNYMDNHDLISIQEPACGGRNHPLYDSSGQGTLFYEITTNPKDTLRIGANVYAQPYNRNSFILISAGWDGIYGTRDDIHNFTKE